MASTTFCDVCGKAIADPKQDRRFLIQVIQAQHYERTLQYDVHKACADTVVKKIAALFLPQTPRDLSGAIPEPTGGTSG